MRGLEAAINVLTLLTVPTITVERFTNAFKIRTDRLRIRHARGSEAERDRHRGMQTRSLLTGMFVAILCTSCAHQMGGKPGEPTVEPRDHEIKVSFVIDGPHSVWFHQFNSTATGGIGIDCAIEYTFRYNPGKHPRPRWTTGEFGNSRVERSFQSASFQGEYGFRQIRTIDW